MGDIELRSLEVEDVFAVARMLARVTKGARMQLAAVITGKKRNPTEVGMVVFQSIFTEAEEDLKGWLASLIGKDLAEFKTMPATTVLDIVEKLATQESIRDFFVKASLLASKISLKG